MVLMSKRVLSESDAKPESFHDVHVHGLHWRRDRFAFLMDIQYILEWIIPTGSSSAYSFMVCEAQITFRNVYDLQISLEWVDGVLDAQIDGMQVTNVRTMRNGEIQRHYEISFSTPEANITLWSAGYEVSLLGEPVLSAVTSIPYAE